MTTSTLSPQELTTDAKFLGNLDTGLAIRYVLFSSNQHGMNESVSAAVFGYKKSGELRQLFWFQTTIAFELGIYANSKSRFDFFRPEERPVALEKTLTEWHSKSVVHHPWWHRLITLKPFTGIVVFNTNPHSMREVDAYHPSLDIYHGILLGRIDARADALADMADSDQSMKEKSEAAQLLRRRFGGFVAKVQSPQVANYFGNTPTV